MLNQSLVELVHVHDLVTAGLAEDGGHAGELAPLVETTSEVVGAQPLPAARVPTVGVVGPAREVEVWKEEETRTQEHRLVHTKQQ
jgi:hypothetical protein